MGDMEVNNGPCILNDPLANTSTFTDTETYAQPMTNQEYLQENNTSDEQAHAGQPENGTEHLHDLTPEMDKTWVGLKMPSQSR
jgi:hypothetical protein